MAATNNDAKVRRIMNNLTSAGHSAFAITPNDSADLAAVIRGVYVGASGDITGYVWGSGDTAITFTAVAGGQILDVAFRRIRATGTTATGLIGLP